MYEELSMLEARARTQEDTTAISTHSQIREKSGNKDDKYCPKKERNPLANTANTITLKHL
jgi:hypothetical protein